MSQIMRDGVLYRDRVMYDGNRQNIGFRPCFPFSPRTLAPAGVILVSAYIPSRKARIHQGVENTSSRLTLASEAYKVAGLQGSRGLPQVLIGPLRDRRDDTGRAGQA